ncbi:mitochondrial folate transporter/carrier [Ascoidea rubescens DSM 1968]|uniref:Mitochondrial folate transporter/carrier n=1 Tax=Ascoidea rubescens DSM 1968 TaxID=1344418 RepID=A0A1D2VGR8_9ASCO|nr:mitochondrial folate transporter/carrier [Ascoidea rubescens DSM 1968]ODV60740.1 mitochondrial folate transporter/carrier [Ascoidea rubescens DSM 1968]
MVFGDSVDMKELSPRSKEVISGLTAGFLTTLITHPLDLIKIRLQLDYSNQSHYIIFKNIVNNIRDSRNPIISEIYRGIFPNLIGNSIAWSLYFTLYNDFKSRINFNFGENNQKNSTQNYFASAFLAGSLTTLMTNPIWVLKTRILSTSKTSPGAYKSLSDGIKRILKEESILTFWKGSVPALIGVSKGAIQFSIYDNLKDFVYSSKNMKISKEKQKLSSLQYITLSSTSQIIATTTLYPLQIFKSRLQDYNHNINKQKKLNQNILSIFNKTFKNEGFTGFYKGLSTNLIRVLPATCITFTTYENLKHYLN